MPYDALSSEKQPSEKQPVTGMLATQRWESLSFASTLYLCPILDALLAPTPDLFHDELRLGLQEALVNAAKHGNQLDPQKVVSVRYAKVDGYYWWIVSDQGKGFKEPPACPCPSSIPSADHPSVSECGRGLFILHQVFDQVRWSNNGREICLAKQAQPLVFSTIISPAFFLKFIESWWRRWSAASVRSA